MTDPELARRGALVAADLERRGYTAAGVVRQMARALLGIHQLDGRTCQHCREHLTGRQRVWCSERCRRRHRA